MPERIVLIIYGHNMETLANLHAEDVIMGLLRNGLKVYLLTPDDIETMLISRYGSKLAPVDKVALARIMQAQKQQEARMELPAINKQSG